MAEADLNKILGYIQQREETLSRYSDKLRQSLVKIANMFGKSNYCRRCGKWQGYHSTTHRQTYGACENFEPAIEVSINVTDDKHFYVEPEDDASPEIKYYLAVLNHELGYIDVVGEYNAYGRVTTFQQAPRELLKALVKSGRLIPFLQKVADTLQAKSEEYREVAQVAEKMAQAVQ
jgi:hypothetical protein